MLWDKTAADIQEDVAIADQKITGTSKYVATWSTPGFDPDEGTNYIALHFKATGGYSLKCAPIPEHHVSAEFTDDDVVLQINDETTGVSLYVYDSDDNLVDTIVYDLDVELETE